MLSNKVVRSLVASQTRCFASKAHFAQIMPYMDETRKDLVQMVEAFADAEVAPLAEDMDKTMKFPHHMWKRMGDQGLLGITASEEYGGLGLGYFDHCLVTEQLSKANGGLGLSYLAHSNLCINQFELNANDAQKKKYLPGLIAGDLVGSLAMSEPNSGSDVTSMQLKAVKKGDKYILNGSKMWITNGPSADVIWVYAKTDMNAGHKGISTFIVEKGFKGFSVAQKLDKFGVRGSETGELVFEDCEVPAENLVTHEGNGVYILMRGLDSERLILSAGALGINQAAVDESLLYTSDRKQFNKKLIEQQIVQAKLADMYCDLQATRSMVYSSAHMFDSGVKSNLDSASVFLQASRSAVRAADECMQLHGGNGYINEYKCGRLYRDAKLYDIGGGTKEIRQWLMGRELEKMFR